MSVIDALLHGPIWKEYQILQSVRTLDSSLQNFLFHKCEEELQSAAACMQSPWMILATSTPSLYRFSLLILLCPSLLLKDSQQSESNLLTMLAEMFSYLISLMIEEQKAYLEVLHTMSMPRS